MAKRISANLRGSSLIILEDELKDDPIPSIERKAQIASHLGTDPAVIEAVERSSAHVGTN
jgi:hypothetical protein